MRSIKNSKEIVLICNIIKTIAFVLLISLLQTFPLAAEVTSIGDDKFLKGLSSRVVRIDIYARGPIDILVKNNGIPISSEWLKKVMSTDEENGKSRNVSSQLSTGFLVPFLFEENEFEFSGYAENEYHLAVREGGKFYCKYKVKKNFKYSCKIKFNAVPTYELTSELTHINTSYKVREPEEEQALININFAKPKIVSKALALSEPSFWKREIPSKINYDFVFTNKIQIAPLKSMPDSRVKDDKNINLYALFTTKDGVPQLMFEGEDIVGLTFLEIDDEQILLSHISKNRLEKILKQRDFKN